MDKIINPFPNKQLLIYDIETYREFFLAIFYDGANITTFTIRELTELKEYITDKNKIVVGFNNISFDDLILKAIVSDKVSTDEEIYNLATNIIEEKDKKLIYNLKYKTGVSWHASIDLMQLSFSGANSASLKELGVRLNWPLLQELPYGPGESLDKQKKQTILSYCKNDVAITSELWNKSVEEVKLRMELERLYRVNVFSSSRPQCAEKILKHLYLQKSGLTESQLKQLKTDIKEIYVKDCIHQSIVFKTKELQKFLEEIKQKTLPVKTIKEGDRLKKVVEGSGLKQIVVINGKSYSFGVGGFHSEDKPGYFQSNKSLFIIELDVTSYYPFIIIALGLYPSHLTSLWTDNFREITEERVKAKKAGEKLKADAMKIIINSSFGKSGSPYSFMYDPKLMVTVTLMGQLSIMMLIEELEFAGIEVISANTDGITCKVSNEKRADFELIHSQWEKHTKFQLEENIYNRYIRRDINNYIAEYQDGTLKRKGIFDYGNLQKKNDANIIAKALEQYYIHNIPVEETISRHKTLHDFFYHFKAKRNFTVYAGSERLQNINRWYISTNGGMQLQKVKAGEVTRTKIANATSVKIVNDLKIDNLPEDLDYKHYIQEAKKIIYRIQNEKKANKIKALGLYPIPKEFKKNPQGSKMAEVREDWTWGDYTGCACYTGSKVCIVGIDFDIPDIVKIYPLLTNTLTAWHGDGTVEDVLSGKKKGTLIYRCKNEKIYSTSGEFRQKHGFEVIYGNNSVQLTGFHQNGEEYHYTEEVQEITPELERWLLENLPKKRKKKYEPVVNEENDKELIKQIVKKILPQWDYREADGEKYKLQGYCPKYEHTNPQPTDFDIIFMGKGLHCSCFHANCAGEIEELKIQLNEEWKRIKEEFRKLNEEIEEQKRLEQRSEVLQNLTIADCIKQTQRETLEFKNIYDAFRQPARIKLIQAPTGAGKTYNSVTDFLEKLQAGQFVIYITSNKTSMVEFVEQVEARTGRKLSDLYIQELRRGHKIDDQEDELQEETEDDSNTIKKSTLGIITHHTYISRKGLSNLYYSLMRIIEKNNACVIIDEVDSYIQGQTFMLDLQARYQKITHKGMSHATYKRRAKCSGSKNKPACPNCYLKCLADYDCNSDGIPELKHKYKVKEDEFIDKELDLPVLSKIKSVYLPERGLTISQIEQHKTYLDSKDYNCHLQEEEKFNFKNTISDLINSSYNPVIYEYSATFEEKQLTQEEILQMEKEEKYKIKYPYAPCQVQYLSLKDKSCLTFLDKHCSEIVFLSATISQSDREFLQVCFEHDVQEITINSSTQKIDELLVIGYGNYIRYIDGKTRDVNINGLHNYGKVLIFEPTKTEAQTLFKNFPDKYPAAIYDVHDLLVKEKFSEDWKYLISHSRGNIGRAVNLPQFYTCFVNTVIYKPSNAYDLQKFTIQEILEQQEDDRKTTTIQNAGRILRGSGRKIICLSCVDRDEVEYFKNRFALMVNSEIKTMYIEEDQNKLFNAIDYFHRTGELLEVEEYTKVDKLCDSDTSALSPQQRAKLTEEEKQAYELTKEERKRLKREALIEEKIETIKKLQGENLSWREIRNKVNFSKLSQEEQEYIKSVINPDGDSCSTFSG